MVQRAVVIGAGFGGVGAAIKLRGMGLDVDVLERAPRAGGVWRDNDYPGSACDVPSFLYSYSFAPKRDWTRRFAKQPEILTYLEQVIADHGLTKHIRFGADVVAARFERGTGWTVTLADGEQLTADVLVAACGQMSTPDIPDIPGLELYRGPVFHSARWDHDVDLAGRRIAVVGTGSSAIQFVPEIAKVAEKVTILQRSAGYVIGKDDPELDGPVSRWRHYYDRYRAFLVKELFSVRVNHVPALFGPVERRYRSMLEEAVPEVDLREKVSTTDRYGCKRLLVSNDWFPTIRRDNVELRTEAAQAVTETGVITSSGHVIEADVLVFGTGFRSTDFLHGITVTGVEGDDLGERWADGAGAYLGMTVAGFPNLFLIYGPNTNVGHNSILFMIESQLNYLVSAVSQMRRLGIGTIDTRTDLADTFDRDIQRRSARTVYAQGCANWFATASGKHTQNWPGTAIDYWRRTRRLRLSDYTTTSAVPAARPDQENAHVA